MANPVRCSSEQIKEIVITNADAQIAMDSWKYLSTPGIVGYAPVTIDNGADGALFARIERALLPKPTGQTWTNGQVIYYDYGTSVFTNATGITSSFKAGVAEAPQAGTAATTGMAFFDALIHLL